MNRSRLTSASFTASSLAAPRNAEVVDASAEFVAQRRPAGPQGDVNKPGDGAWQIVLPARDPAPAQQRC